MLKVQPSTCCPRKSRCPRKSCCLGCHIGEFLFMTYPLHSRTEHRCYGYMMISELPPEQISHHRTCGPRKPFSPSATTRRWRNCTPGRLVRRWWPQEPPGTCGNCSARAACRSAGAAFKLPDADYISFFVATRVARPSGLNQRPLLNRNQLDIAELFPVYDTPRRFSCVVASFL